MKFNLLNLSLALLVPQAFAMPKEDVPTGFDEKDFIPTATRAAKTSTTTIVATVQTTKSLPSKTSTEFDYSNVVCTNYDYSPFSSLCSERTGTVKHTTKGINCTVSARCIFNGTTVSFNNNNYTFPPTGTNGSTPTNISTNGHCGSTDGKCPSGECCSKYGWCGTSADHCSVEKGCQKEFGKCIDDKPTELPVSTNDRCGSKDGKCPSGKCCSKHGWCGTTADYCSVKNGCQSEFGKCDDDKPTELPVSTNDRCGSKDGKCPSGKCCSKHGWCGTSDDHCSVKKGCQSEFGKCK